MWSLKLCFTSLWGLKLRFNVLWCLKLCFISVKLCSKHCIVTKPTKETLYHNFVLRRKLCYNLLKKNSLWAVIVAPNFYKLHSTIPISNTFQIYKFTICTSIPKQIRPCLIVSINNPEKHYHVLIPSRLHAIRIMLVKIPKMFLQ